jgi:flagellin
LAVESANGTYQDADDRANLQAEVTALISEVDRISSSTNFNGTTLLDGTATGIVFQIGSDNATSQQVSLSIATMSASGLSISSIDISTQTGAQSAIDTVKTAIKAVSEARANLGAMQNRLEHTTNNLSTMSENLTSAESTIRDVDMSSEMVDLTKNQILEQAATSMLAQANAQPQSVLSLLQG